ncbi:MULTISPECIES: orotidine-5'-phosphate decarboxylase [unclassified Guyparkeria]|uniref:orotidine-5'-phosphate decarboxylase n=1 Tax=unclassified Guyparkeria TaxID=2626246 RepID=UPI000733451D|nr:MULTISPECIES: orotidine-5'-phosphate decarboxylase [unclassified Guyparkeria]KTG17662.1 orotidine 5'-phosphate decarboxylase [Guyparkeria sp. XI15]OAE88475.1 orotidine 5'-phosphate decarboxylase [Guyparkeria sp. WRN-7]
MARHRSQPRIYVALDAADEVRIRSLLAELNPSLCGIKIGKEAFTALGPRVVEWARERGFPVFLDLKFHDIPNTVAQACRAAAELDVALVNVHASGGRRMLEAAREAIPASTDAPGLIAVTVLTSMEDTDLAEIGVDGGAAAQVELLARLTADTGLDGVVCSAHEAATMRAVFPGEDGLVVTPGVRPAGSARDDQRRVVTPAEALSAGATSLVIGRPITAAEAPGKALETIVAGL